jgi:signal transduction histidine kinase
VTGWRGVGTATTITLTVVASMALGFSLQQLVAFGLDYLGLPRSQVVQQHDLWLQQQLPGRIAGLSDVVDAIRDPAQRQAIIAAAQRPRIQIRLLDAPIPNLTSGVQPSAEALRRQIETILMIPRPVIVSERYGPPDKQTAPAAKGDAGSVFIETALSDGHWLLLRSFLPPPPSVDAVAIKFSRASFATWLALSFLLGIVLSMLAARRLVKPLSELAIAVERIGGAGDAPLAPLRGPREVQGTIEAFNRMQDRLRRFNMDRMRMIAAMSHDLRTPLTRLRLRAELVDNPDHQQKMLRDLDMMGEMIESVLALARDDTKREPRSLVDVSALVEGICEDASDAGEPVTFSGPRGVTISCRPTALRRAISNIVDNAVKYGRSAAVSLSSESERVVITVDDEGPGIPPSERKKVFEPFYRIDASRDPDTGGVGLGLFVTRSIVWEHGGEISLASRMGGGLSVRLELPVGSRPISLSQAEIMSNGDAGRPDSG